MGVQKLYQVLYLSQFFVVRIWCSFSNKQKIAMKAIIKQIALGG